MITLTLKEVARAVGGTLHGSDRGEIRGVSTDTRTLTGGAAFFALRGESFDGHQFLETAAKHNAALLVVEQASTTVGAKVPQLVVGDTRRALADLATTWRRIVNPKVIGITGSVGKTTTKELTKHVISALGRTHANRGNFNNEIGLPLTLLAMPKDTQYAVCEMGMNHLGEIAALTKIAEPDVGVITVIAPAHLEGVGSIEGVARAKAELLVGLPTDGTAVVPSHEPLLDPYLAKIAPRRIVRFGTAPEDFVQIAAMDLDPTSTRVTLRLNGEECMFTLPLPGRFNVSNAAAAAAVGLLFGAKPTQLAQALSTPPQLSHRSRIVQKPRWTIIDDCYNANPVAMRVALEALRDLSQSEPRIAILGAMAELGDHSDHYHLEVGEFAARAGLVALIVVGENNKIAEGAKSAGMPVEKIINVTTPVDAASEFKRVSSSFAHCWVLVKASRSAQLEQVVDALTQ